MPVGAENLIRCTDQGRCTRKNVGTYRATYVLLSVAPAVRQDPDGDLEILVSNPIGVFGTHRFTGRQRVGTAIGETGGSRPRRGAYLWCYRTASFSRSRRSIAASSIWTQQGAIIR